MESGSKSSARAELDARTLWSDETGRRWFLVPDSAALPPGGLLMRTIGGQRESVDAVWAQAFEVGPAEAGSWLRTQLDPAVDALRGVIGETVARLREATVAMRARNDGERRRRSEVVRTTRQALAEAVRRLSDEATRLRRDHRWASDGSAGGVARLLDVLGDRAGTIADELRAKAEEVRVRRGD
jgi:hypothetical protein